MGADRRSPRTDGAGSGVERSARQRLQTLTESWCRQCAISGDIQIWTALDLESSGLQKALAHTKSFTRWPWPLGSNHMHALCGTIFSAATLQCGAAAPSAAARHALRPPRCLARTAASGSGTVPGAGRSSLPHPGPQPSVGGMQPHAPAPGQRAPLQRFQVVDEQPVHQRYLTVYNRRVRFWGAGEDAAQVRSAHVVARMRAGCFECGGAAPRRAPACGVRGRTRARPPPHAPAQRGAHTQTPCMHANTHSTHTP